MAQIPTYTPISTSAEWSELEKEFLNKSPSEKANFTHYEEMMKQVARWYQEQIPGFGIGSSGPVQIESKADKPVEIIVERAVINFIKLIIYIESRIRYRTFII